MREQRSAGEVIEAARATMTTTTEYQTDHDSSAVYLPLPKLWNESQIPYFGDLSPKPSWEIIVKVRPFCKLRKFMKL